MMCVAAYENQGLGTEAELLTIKCMQSKMVYMRVFFQLRFSVIQYRLLSYHIARRLLFCHRSCIKNKIQTAVINIFILIITT